MILHGLLLSYMALYGHFTVFYGLSWQNIDLIGLVSSFLAVIDPNIFGLVKSDLMCLEACKNIFMKPMGKVSYFL